jgi:hypothetical protein
MPLPAAIQAQVDQANATLEAVNAPPTPEAQGTESEPPEPESHADPQPPLQQQTDVWEHKYKTLQGLFNREVPTLQNKVRDLETQLQDAVAKLNKVADDKVKAEPEKPIVDPKDADDFGSDLVEMVQRVAESMLRRAAGDFQNRATALEQRLVQLEQVLRGTTQTVAVTAEQAFFDRLVKLVPDWEAINENQAFLAWLSEVDPMLGQPRQTALDAAQQTLNADRAAAVFKAFTGTQPAARPGNLDKQVSPKGTATAPVNSSKAPVLYTEQQIVDFYNAKRRGEFRHKEQEVAQLEAEINLAISEGRVR